MVNKRRIVRVLMVLGLLLAPVLAGAQGVVAGAIAGVVKDTTGGVLPGATVEATSPALIEKVRTVVTDDQGRYQIVDLRAGTYTVTVSVPGFGTVRREGIELTTGFTATVSVELAVGTVEDAVTVSGVTPFVDTRNVVKQTTLPDAVLDALPIARTMGSYASVLPAATSTNANDMGGLQGERGGGFAVHGGGNLEINVNQDGLNVTMLNSSVYSYNPSATQEIVIELQGTSAESFSAGARVNVVPKEGGNRFSGETYGNWSGLQASNLSGPLRARGLTATPSIKRNYTVEGSFGGPIKKDRLWFFTAHRYWVANSYIPGNFFNKLNGTLLYEPDLSRPFSTQDYFRDHTLRLTGQVSKKDKVSANLSIQDNCTCPIATIQRPEATGNHFYAPSMQGTATWTRPITNQVLFEAAGGRTLTAINAKPGPDHVPGAISVMDTGLGFMYGSRANTGDTTFAGHSENYGVGTWNQMISGRVALSYITGSHAFKAGMNLGNFQNRNKQSQNVDMIGGAVRYTFRTQVPLSVRIYATPWGRASDSLYTGAFVQDQWALRKLTLNLGLRYDGFSAVAIAQSFAAGYWVGARDFPEVRDVPNWKNINPRMGASYDVFGNAGTLLKGSMGRYVLGVSSIGNNGLALDQPINNQALYADRTWNDRLFGPGDPRTGNLKPDCVLGPSVPEANGECGALSNLNFGKTLEAHSNSQTADDVLHGFQSAQEYLWQGDVSLEHEFRPGLLVTAGYFRSVYGNIRTLKNLRVSSADYDPYCITAPVDPRLPGGGGNRICGLYDIKPTAFGQNFGLTTKAENYGKASNSYSGVDVNVKARFGQDGVLQGGMSTGALTTDNCFVVDSPQALYQCRVSPSWAAATNVKFLLVYPLPWNFRASVIYQNLPGTPITATYTATNAEILPSLGRNLGSCRGAAVCNGTTTIELIAPKTAFEDRRSRTDLRFSRIFKVGGASIDGELDIYNILNANDVLSMITSYGASWQRVNEILAGRFVKFGVRVYF
jgi:hypothetical protein